MKFYKSIKADGNLARLDRAESNVSGGEEISDAEYYGLKVGIRVFLNGEDPETLTAKDWGVAP